MVINHPGAHLQNKTPELEKSLSLVQHLQSHDDSEPLIARYSLADAVFAKAEIDTMSAKVNLWLGANVMLEYTYQEAIDLLETKLVLAKKELEEVTSDLGFTRNQIITAEVCISRIYNWDVRRKRQLQKSD
jgi:prefoldin subunit 5